MPDQARAIAKELGVYYYETSVLTYYGVNEVFENAIRAALIARRQQRFWMTNLKKVQRPLLQVGWNPLEQPALRNGMVYVWACTYSGATSVALIRMDASIM
jgi:Rho-related BTB domain-containing protein 1/2